MKNLDELKDLDKAIFCGDPVHKRGGVWRFPDGRDIVSSYNSGVVTNRIYWDYVEKVKPVKEPEFNTIYRELGKDKNECVITSRYIVHDVDGPHLCVTIDECPCSIENFWDEWEEV